MDKMNIKTNLRIIKNGSLVQTVHNTIVNTGLAALSGLLLSDIGGTAFDYMAIGEGTTTVSAADTALEDESMRIAGTGTQATNFVTNDTARLTASFTIDDTYAITEAGILNASTSGTLLNHVVFSSISVESGDTLEIQWDITFANA